MHQSPRSPPRPAPALRPAALAGLLLLLLPVLGPLPGPASAAPDPLDLSWGDWIAASPDGTRVFVTGHMLNEHTHTYDSKTVAYNATTGAVDWVATYNGFGDALALEWTIYAVVSPDGRHVFVGGFSANALVGKDLKTDMLVISYNASTGAFEWEARYKGPRPTAWWSLTQAMVASSDSRFLYVTGLVLSDGSYLDLLAFDIVTLKLDATTGNLSWVAIYNGLPVAYLADPTKFEDWGYDIALSPDERAVVVTGRNYMGALSKWNYLTAAYDTADGRELWNATYDGPWTNTSNTIAPIYGVNLGDWPTALEYTRDGTAVLVTGRSMGNESSNYDIATVAYDATTGAQLWVDRYDGPGHMEDAAYSMVMHPAGGRAYVTGWSVSGDPDQHFDYITLCYDTATGLRLWEQRYHASGAAMLDDLALSIQMDPSGHTVYVGGWSYALEDTYAYAVVAYDSLTGAQRWVARHPGTPANNFDFATNYNAPGDDTDMIWLAVAPGGERVYFSGTSKDVTFLAAGLDAATGAGLWFTHH